MPRTARSAPGGVVFHVLNRDVGRMRLFLKEADFEAFERAIEKTLATRPMRICAYCLMPNHWHFVLWPERDGDLCESDGPAVGARIHVAFPRPAEESHALKPDRETVN